LTIGIPVDVAEEFEPLGFLNNAANDALDVDLLLVMLILLSKLVLLAVEPVGGGEIERDPILNGCIGNFVGGVGFLRLGDISLPEVQGEIDMELLNLLAGLAAIISVPWCLGIGFTDGSSRDFLISRSIDFLCRSFIISPGSVSSIDDCLLGSSILTN
jgi:hypothetical protein